MPFTTPPVALLVLQARILDSPLGGTLRSSPVRPASGSRSALAGCRFFGSGTAPGVSEAAFGKAMALMEFVCFGLEESFHAARARSELLEARNALESLQAELNLLRATTQLRAAPGTERATFPAQGKSTQRVVERVMAYVPQHFHRPLSLGEMAAALRMNASYLASVFKAGTGVAFHKYLENFRMAKAGELLRDSHYRVREVASAVGYATADQFRHDLTARCGVPPSACRLGRWGPGAA